MFYGSRVKDNLEYRTNNASDLYTTDYLPNRSEEVDKEAYNNLKKIMPKSSDWTKLSEYELEDSTSGMQTLACSGDVCEVVDIN